MTSSFPTPPLPSPAARHRTAFLRWLLPLLLLGLLLASPFLTSSGVGTGEAYNYSLALADGVTQLRAGEIPVLVGQTDYAFNGRVHPLRNAPYLIYLAGALDVVTLRQLSFWQLQNLSLTLSLVGLVVATWWALRWSTGCRGSVATGLTGLFVFSPPVLGAAYSLDLFMTVHAAAFVPLALAGAIREFRRRHHHNDIVLAGALGLAWWAHPPVALWTTALAVTLRVLAVAGPRPGESLLRLLLALGAAGAISAFVFVSATEITPYRQLGDTTEAAQSLYVDTTLASIADTVPGTLLPVSREAREPTDLQLGYGLAALLFLTGFLAGRRRPGFAPAVRPLYLLAGAAFGLILLSLPVPGLTAFVWSQLPLGVHAVTGAWPNQRLYLVAAAAIVLAVALLSAERRPADWPLLSRRWRFLAAIALVGWTAWQAYPFLHRGLETRWSAEQSWRRHLPTNVDLTVTSYAFVGTPPTFVHGVMEPWAEFQLRPARGDASLVGNYRHALEHGVTAATGELRQESTEPGTISAQAELQLQPGRHYLLAFEWLVAEREGALVLTGPSTDRRYFLPSSGGPEAFGMGDEHRTAFALSTSQDEIETVTLQLHLELPGEMLPESARVASYRLLEVDPAGLPVRLTSLFPLQCTVTSTRDDYYVETPRRYLPGYAATVNGRAVRPIASPRGQVMVPVPEGTSQVELRFEGSVRLHRLFWGSLAAGGAWVLLAGASLVGRPRSGRWGAATLAVPGVALLAVTVGYGLTPEPALPRPLASAGPLLFDLLLPTDKLGSDEVILSSGVQEAGNVIFVRYEDDAHVRIGIDVWGTARVSEPIAVDYQQPQELTLSAGFLYPADQPETKTLTPWIAEQLLNRVRIELNGLVALDEMLDTHPSPWEQVEIGRASIGSSMDHVPFTGEIRRVQRLVVPEGQSFTDSQGLAVRWPQQRWGNTEPLITLQRRDGDELLTATYHQPDQVQLAYHRPEQPALRSGLLSTNFTGDARLQWTEVDGNLQITLDDAPALTVPQWRSTGGQPLLAWTAVNQPGIKAVAARFTGPALTLLQRESPTGTATGPARLWLELPLDKIGQAEPLIITGEAGRADAFYITYVDDGHIQFGLDHWGVGAHQSPVIPVAYDELHQLDVAMGSLHPPVADGAWGDTAEPERQRRKREVVVRLNDEEVWRAEIETYDVAPAAIAIGSNAIGVSSCGPEFTGRLLNVQRLGVR